MDLFILPQFLSPFYFNNFSYLHLFLSLNYILWRDVYVYIILIWYLLHLLGSWFKCVSVFHPFPVFFLRHSFFKNPEPTEGGKASHKSSSGHILFLLRFHVFVIVIVTSMIGRSISSLPWQTFRRQILIVGNLNFLFKASKRLLHLVRKREQCRHL